MLHFAPRYGIISICLTQARDLRVRKAANDNGPGQRPIQRAGARHRPSSANDEITTREEALLEAALKMFAAHGLSAALRACEAAEIAAAGGDHAGAEWWLAVCATFDGALARSAARTFVAR